MEGPARLERYAGHAVIIEGSVVARVRGVAGGHLLVLADLNGGASWCFDLRRMRRDLRILPLEAEPERE